MFLVRDIMYCKPGKVRPMVEKFTALATLSEKHGIGKLRITTDMSAERFWTVVAETEVENLDRFNEQTNTAMQQPEFQAAMKGYHDLVESGRREIYTIEL
jgi:hypothetical protein